jgi:hypothetical protein
MQSESRQQSRDREKEIPDFLAQMREIRDELELLTESLDKAAGDWREYLRRRMDSQPYRTMAVAIVAGCMTSCLLPPALLRNAVGLGGRLLLARLLSQSLDALRSTDGSGTTEAEGEAT